MEYSDDTVRFLLELYKSWPWAYDQGMIIDMQAEMIRRLETRVTALRRRPAATFPRMRPKIDQRRKEFGQVIDDRRNSV